MLEVLEARTLLSFSTPVNYPVGANPVGVAAADLTGNGNVDLVVINEKDQTFSVLLGNGDGSFQIAHTYATGSEPNAIAVGEFTNRGIPDIAVANSGSNTVSVYLGNGDGTFQDPISFAAGPVPADLAVGDFNGDGNLDLVVATRGGITSDRLSVFLGNGDGTFRASGTLDTGVLAPRVVVADLKGDGIADLAVAGFSDVTVFLGNGDGTFQAPHSYDAGKNPLAIAAGDLTGDGIPDVAVTHFDGNTVSVLLGNGDGSFQPPTDFTVGTSMHAAPFSVQMADLTGSGIPKDLVTANYNDDNVSVLLGNGDGTFRVVQNFSTDVGPLSVAVGDFKGDGFPDLATANALGNDVSVLLNQADWHPASGGRHYSSPPASGGTAVTGFPADTLAFSASAWFGQSTSTPTAQALETVPVTVKAPVTDQGQWDRFFTVLGGADQPATSRPPRLETRTEMANALGLADPLAANLWKVMGDL
jgi:hypothetical protein